ncbi:hypothetical protein VUN82_10190 [Micrococcaceae bacterium Sec5.1]
MTPLSGQGYGSTSLRTGSCAKLYERFAGYYFNVGASDLIISGDIRVHQTEDVQSFVPRLDPDLS